MRRRNGETVSGKREWHRWLKPKSYCNVVPGQIFKRALQLCAQQTPSLRNSCAMSTKCGVSSVQMLGKICSRSQVFFFFFNLWLPLVKFPLFVSSSFHKCIAREVQGDMDCAAPDGAKEYIAAKKRHEREVLVREELSFIALNEGQR